jgi:hypothetical protein
VYRGYDEDLTDNADQLDNENKKKPKYSRLATIPEYYTFSVHLGTANCIVVTLALYPVSRLELLKSILLLI